jgi:hypothetical protein
MAFDTNDSEEEVSKRGFAAMDEEQQREIASKGGKAAHEKGTAHEFNSQTGSAAAKKRGQGQNGSTPEASEESNNMNDEEQSNRGQNSSR